MKNLVSRKRIILYFILSLAFAGLFQWIKPWYAYQDGPTPSPIDSRPLEWPFHFWDNAYVIAAKTGYNIPHYYGSFFIIDLVFPVVYTLLFLSILELVRDKKLRGKKIYPLLRFMVFAGCALDYIENISFAIFLQMKSNGFAGFVAGASTIKSVLVAVNYLIAVGIVLGFIFRKRSRSI